jgi:hypothetical protein
MQLPAPPERGAQRTVVYHVSTTGRLGGFGAVVLGLALVALLGVIVVLGIVTLAIALWMALAIALAAAIGALVRSLLGRTGPPPPPT